MSDNRLMVRMAEQAFSSNAGDVLVSLGLGSCIGLALVDTAAGVAGLAHIVLPSAPPAGPGASPGKYADTAVPLLIEKLVRLGASHSQLRAVMCGGAAMFASKTQNGALQIGERNVIATTEALTAARLAVKASDIGGSTGRSIEVRVRSGEVLVRGVGQAPRQL